MEKGFVFFLFYLLECLLCRARKPIPTVFKHPVDFFKYLLGNLGVIYVNTFLKPVFRFLEWKTLKDLVFACFSHIGGKMLSCDVDSSDSVFPRETHPAETLCFGSPALDP